MSSEVGKVNKKGSSCAECKRLKMKCDRNTPCSSCLKRGLSSLCLSNQTLRPGKGTRYILSSTEELHAKIDQLLERTRDLEVALDASHSLHSTETHGLLKKDLLVEGSRLALERDHDEETEVPVAALGTLKISQKTGGAEWIGSTASSYFFVQEEDAASITSSIDTLPEHEGTLREMMGSLPEKAEAWSLLESFHENFTWNYNPIPRTLLIRDFLIPTYDRNQGPPSLQHLSVLFSMFSIGALMDLSRVPNSAEAKMYRDVAKIPLDIESLSKDTSLTTIEALIMYAQAIQWSDDPNGPALTWTYLSLCATLGESIGLHRDPKTTWNMDDATTLRRRRVFWELMYMVTWQCLVHGRPPLLTQRHVDVQLPEEETAETMGTNPTYHIWRYRWTKQLGWETTEQMLSPAYPPTHALVMKLDKKIREFTFPWDVNVKPDMETEGDNVLLDFQNMMMNGILELNSLHVHRGFFAHALFQSPTDPLQSKFSASVYSAFTAACRLIQRSHDYHSRRPHIMRRSSILYSHTFSAAVIVGAIATQAPQCKLATAALHELDIACSIFRVGKDNIRVSKILFTVMRVQSKAKEKFQTRMGIIRQPDPSVDLPGIIGAPAVVQKGGRSRDGSTKNSNSPPVDSPPAPYESPPNMSRYKDEHEPPTPMYTARPPLNPEEPWYPPQQPDPPMRALPQMDMPTQYSGYTHHPDIYMEPNRFHRTLPQEAYGWQHDTRTTVIIPNRNLEPSPLPQPQPQPRPHEIYQNGPLPQPYHQYHHPMAVPSYHMSDNQNLFVAPDQSWSSFLGRMGL